MKTSNREKVTEFARMNYASGDKTHWDEFVKRAKVATGAKIVREDWLREIGAKSEGVDREYLKVHYKPRKDRLCPKAPATHTYEALQNSTLWIFG